MGFLDWLAGKSGSSSSSGSGGNPCCNCLHYFEYMGDRGCSNFFAPQNCKYNAHASPTHRINCPQYSSK
ncbi:MAG: hypothetical protein E7617_05685 [Ruminococcaceae bacterium]|nr:hypothetical protein [Oscillospiraceae bacterium]